MNRYECVISNLRDHHIAVAASSTTEEGKRTLSMSRFQKHDSLVAAAELAMVIAACG